MPDTQPNTRSTFQELQYEFTAHLRDPATRPAPKDIEDRRMEIYRGLLYRNVEGFVSNAFPVLRKLYNDEDWHHMIRDFFANHQSHSPYFKDVSREFLDYLSNERETQAKDPDFIIELAHYEWLEISLTFDDTPLGLEHIDTQGDLLAGVPAVSPLAQLHAYQYPVHQIKPEFIPETPGEQPTFLLVYRDLKDEVSFMEMNAMTARLFDLLRANETARGEEVLAAIADEIPQLDRDIVLKGGEQTLRKFFEKDIVLGIKQ